MPDNFPPTEDVLKMKKGGMSDYQIKKELEKKGYSFQQISEALNQVDIKSGVEEGGNSGMQLSAINEEKSEDEFIPVPTPQATNQAPQDEYKQQSQNVMSNVGSQQMSFQPQQPSPFGNLQSLVEEIVEEKWSELMVNVGDINVWKAKMVDDVESVKQEVVRMQSRFENMQSAVLGKVKEYNEGIKDIGVEMKALERVFEKIIEPLTMNVKELSRITEELRGKKLGPQF
ncbi:hypothetical protein HY643_04835 [Candidatus Woesearchaeota archaeon]|nr:hypothetical protein [Candidatus Woesearchaeota archaeon]